MSDCGVSVVRLIEINIVRLEAGEASFDGFQNMGTAETRTIGSVPHAGVNFGGQYDVLSISTGLHPMADDLLGLSCIAGG